MYISILRTRVSHCVSSNSRYTLEFEQMLVAGHAKLTQVWQMVICAKYLIINKFLVRTKISSRVLRFDGHPWLKCVENFRDAASPRRVNHGKGDIREWPVDAHIWRCTEECNQSSEFNERSP